ncbi:hypothetical protein AALO_G00114350 [Alosa alosa]|uniref:Uncharacterized protein n=1 Tax=Alosa alosa TaxID=278164 RepID=A0AAV6GQX6_9TELE|nr:hypothetical protein AALO_G00114350 [Alosa alosa]
MCDLVLYCTLRTWVVYLVLYCTLRTLQNSITREGSLKELVIKDLWHYHYLQVTFALYIYAFSIPSYLTLPFIVSTESNTITKQRSLRLPIQYVCILSTYALFNSTQFNELSLSAYVSYSVNTNAQGCILYAQFPEKAIARTKDCCLDIENVHPNAS